MQNSSDTLGKAPKKQQAALRQMLTSPDTRKVLELLRGRDAGQLQSAAKSAMQGDASALTRLVEELVQNPEAAAAMENMNRTLTEQ